MPSTCCVEAQGRLAGEKEEQDKRAATASKASQKLQAVQQQPLKKAGSAAPAVRLKASKRKRRGPRLIKGAVVRVRPAAPQCWHGTGLPTRAQRVLQCCSASCLRCGPGVVSATPQPATHDAAHHLLQLVHHADKYAADEPTR